jgi:hypothetical protein
VIFEIEFTFSSLGEIKEERSVKKNESKKKMARYFPIFAVERNGKKKKGHKNYFLDKNKI